MIRGSLPSLPSFIAFIIPQPFASFKFQVVALPVLEYCLLSVM